MKQVLGIGLIIGGLFWWAKEQSEKISQNFSQTVQKLNYRIVALRNVNWVGGINFWSNEPKLTFDFDLEVSNPTAHNWNVSGAGLVKLVKLEFLDLNNNLLGVATPNLEAVNLPAKGKALFKNIKAEIPAKKLPNILSNLQNFDLSQIKFRPTLNIAGTNYTLNQN
jgi:hypothetical protein